MDTYMPVGLALILATVSGGVAAIVFYLVGWREGVDAAMSRPRIAPDAAWWCPTCEIAICGQEVTFQETHDPRFGGCGMTVTTALPVNLAKPS